MSGGPPAGVLAATPRTTLRCSGSAARSERRDDSAERIAPTRLAWFGSGPVLTVSVAAMEEG
jgi:hypothetical protein